MYVDECVRVDVCSLRVCVAGLSFSEAEKLRNFLHFTEPRSLKQKSILETAEMDPSIDFLNPLSNDVPKGTLSLSRSLSLSR